MASVAFVVETDAGPKGPRRCVAARDVHPGELILLEPALAAVLADPATHALSDGEFRLEQAFAEVTPAERQEWELTHKLLSIGKRAAWTEGFTHPALRPVEEYRLGATTLASRHQLAVPEVLAVHCTVANNAFALETPVFGVGYGAGFFEHMAAFNHSCVPNCVSIKLGGNMAMFAGPQPIKRGDELCHSYIPPRLLLLDAAQRGKHLHFGCVCARCTSETAADRDAMAAVRLPAGHAKGEHGMMIAEFKCAAAVGDHEACIQAGDGILRKMHPLLLQHPVAAIETVDMYICAVVAVTAVPLMLRTATKLLAGSVDKIKGMACYAGCVAPLQQLSLTAGLLLYLGGGLREVTVPRLLASVQGFARLYGGTLACFRDDLPILGQFGDRLGTPTLDVVISAIAALPPGDPSVNIPGLELDRCSNPACAKARMSTTAPPYKRCSRCRDVVYCSAACQKKGWTLEHKATCSPASPAPPKSVSAAATTA